MQKFDNKSVHNHRQLLVTCCLTIFQREFDMVLAEACNVCMHTHAHHKTIPKPGAMQRAAKPDPAVQNKKHKGKCSRPADNAFFCRAQSNCDFTKLAPNLSNWMSLAEMAIGMVV